MIDGINLFHQPEKNHRRTLDSIRKIATGQGRDHKTGCLLDTIISKNIISFLQQILVNNKHLILILKKYNEPIALEIQIGQKVQQCFLLLQKQKETILDFSQGTLRVL